MTKQRGSEWHRFFFLFLTLLITGISGAHTYGSLAGYCAMQGGVNQAS